MEMFALLLPFQSFSFALLCVRSMTLCSAKLMGIVSFKLVLSNWECNVETRSAFLFQVVGFLPTPHAQSFYHCLLLTVTRKKIL